MHPWFDCRTRKRTVEGNLYIICLKVTAFVVNWEKAFSVAKGRAMDDHLQSVSQLTFEPTLHLYLAHIYCAYIWKLLFVTAQQTQKNKTETYPVRYTCKNFYLQTDRFNLQKKVAVDIVANTPCMHAKPIHQFPSGMQAVQKFVNSTLFRFDHKPAGNRRAASTPVPHPLHICNRHFSTHSNTNQATRTHLNMGRPVETQRVETLL